MGRIRVSGVGDWIGGVVGDWGGLVCGVDDWIGGWWVLVED